MISKNEVRDKILEIALKEFPRLADINITDESNLYGDLGLDSLDMIEIVITIEEVLGVSVTEEEMRTIKTIKEAIDLFHKKLT